LLTNTTEEKNEQAALKAKNEEQVRANLAAQLEKDRDMERAKREGKKEKKNEAQTNKAN
jgi:hypothetical protein